MLLQIQASAPAPPTGSEAAPPPPPPPPPPRPVIRRSHTSDRPPEPAPSLRPALIAGGFLPPHPARFLLGMGSGVAWLDKQSAAQHQFDDSGATFNGTLGLTIYDIFMFSGSFWTVGIDLLVPSHRTTLSYRLSAAYQRYEAGAGFTDEVRIGLTCWLP